MRAVVRESVAAGGIGFATSKAPTHVGWQGRPVPSRVAELSAEIDRLRARLATDEAVSESLMEYAGRLRAGERDPVRAAPRGRRAWRYRASRGRYSRSIRR